jgi:hypothetical protein
METFGLVFHINDEAYQRVKAYRQEMDLRAIQDQITRRGFAMLISYRGQRGFERISQVPALGEAVPWYGNVDAAYRYTCRPEPAGWSLRVENLASGMSFFCAELLPALELHLEGTIQPVPTKPPASNRSPFPRAWIFRDDEALDKLTLTIPAELTAQLAAWPRWGELLSAYEFEFTPGSIGTMIHARHLPSGEELDLTRDANW